MMIFFFSRLFCFVLARRSGFSEGYYFSMMISYVFICVKKKIEVTSVIGRSGRSTGGREGGGMLKKENGKCGKSDGR